MVQSVSIGTLFLRQAAYFWFPEEKISTFINHILFHSAVFFVMTLRLPPVLLFSLCCHLIYGPVTQAERHFFLRGNVILIELMGTRTCGVTLSVDPEKPPRSPAAQSTKFPSGGISVLLCVKVSFISFLINHATSHLL